MTQTSYERKYEVRLQQAMSTLRIFTDMGMYAVIPSTSGRNVKPYIIDINEDTLYSTSCSCYAGEHNMDCIHRLAVDRYLDEQRSTSVEEAIEEAIEALESDDERPANRDGEYTVDEVLYEAFEAMQRIAQADALLANAYESELTYCDVCGKLSRSGRCYRCSN